MCLPKGNPQKIEDSLTNCHIQYSIHGPTSQLTHKSDSSRNNKLYLNLYKAIECDNILQIPDVQKKLYLNNGSICGISTHEDVLNGNSLLLGGLPLTCASTAIKPRFNKIIISKEESLTSDANYFIQGLLTRYWSENKPIEHINSVNMTQKSLGDKKSVFAFVNVLQYTDWINMVMEKLYL